MNKSSTKKATSFHDFCSVLQKINTTRSSKKKSLLFANLLHEASSVRTAGLMAQFVGEGVFSQRSGKRAGLGPKAAALSCSTLCEIDYEIVFKACKNASGSGSETIALLLENMYKVSDSAVQDLSIESVVELAEVFRTIKKQQQKVDLLIDWMKIYPPRSIQYLIRIFSQYSLRIGFELRSVLQSIAIASGQDLEQVRYAHTLCGSLAQVTEYALKGRLDEIEFEVFQPIQFMLASASKINEAPVEDYLAEEKFDGMRAQIHLDGFNAAIYSRDMNDISSQFPELIQQFSTLRHNKTVLDGEIVVYLKDSIQPFRLLQKRMGVKKPSKKLLESFPVRFIAYDILFIDAKSLLNQTLDVRRAYLERFCAAEQIATSRIQSIESKEHIQQLFSSAIESGNEGLVLKKKSSKYEFGQRKKSWLKIKQTVGNLDTVIMYAHAGSGKRGGLYSDFTLGINVSEDDRYSEDFIPIGKAYGGYTNQELSRLNSALKKIRVDRFGPTLSVKPKIVVELEFEQIMQNKRTKAGFSLRLPRFKAIRWDKSPGECNTLKDVEQMYSEDDEVRSIASSQGVVLPKINGL